MNQLDLAEKRTIEWLLNSYSHGSGGFPHSRWIFLPKPWAWTGDYAETTGYLIENLLEFNTACNPEMKHVAASAGAWLVRIQSQDGYFFSGTHFNTPSVFNTAQILFGLDQLYRHTHESKYKDSLSKAFLWLIHSMNENAHFSVGLYHSDFYSAYYARALWAMLLIDESYFNSKYRNLLENSVDVLYSYNVSGQTLHNMGFFPDKPALLHTVMYSLEGLYESSKILGRSDIESCSLQLLEKLVNHISQMKSTPGKLFPDFSFDTSFICVTGQAQLCSLLLKVDRSIDFPLFRGTAHKLFQQLLNWQNHSHNSEHCGALPSSIPVWGKYFPFRYTNWTLKFFLDACYQMKRVWGKYN